MKTASCVKKLKVLADNARLSVLKSLMEGPKRVGELSEDLDIEQTLLSHHLKVLREQGLVETERDGKCIIYSLSKSTAAKTKQGLDLGCCSISFEV